MTKLRSAAAVSPAPSRWRGSGRRHRQAAQQGRHRQDGQADAQHHPGAGGVRAARRRVDGKRWSAGRAARRRDRAGNSPPIAGARLAATPIINEEGEKHQRQGGEKQGRAAMRRTSRLPPAADHHAEREDAAATGRCPRRQAGDALEIGRRPEQQAEFDGDDQPEQRPIGPVGRRQAGAPDTAARPAWRRAPARSSP